MVREENYRRTLVFVYKASREPLLCTASSPRGLDSLLTLRHSAQHALPGEKNFLSRVRLQLCIVLMGYDFSFLSFFFFFSARGHAHATYDVHTHKTRCKAAMERTRETCRMTPSRSCFSILRCGFSEKSVTTTRPAPHLSPGGRQRAEGESAVFVRVIGSGVGHRSSDKGEKIIRTTRSRRTITTNAPSSSRRRPHRAFPPRSIHCSLQPCACPSSLVYSVTATRVSASRASSIHLLYHSLQN